MEQLKVQGHINGQMGTSILASSVMERNKARAPGRNLSRRRLTITMVITKTI
jgi:hypothetical protein